MCWCWSIWFLVRPLFSFCRWSSCCVLTWGERYISFSKGTNHTVRVPPSWSNYPLKAPPANIITQGVAFHTWILGRHNSAHSIFQTESFPHCVKGSLLDYKFLLRAEPYVLIIFVSPVPSTLLGTKHIYRKHSVHTCNRSPSTDLG